MSAPYYLLDTNSYLRAAKCPTCILGNHPAVKLRMTQELVDECNRLPRLKPIFSWVHDPPHPQDRQQWTFQASRKDAAKIKSERSGILLATSHVLADEAAKKRARGYSSALSPVDESVVCVASSLDLGIVTDERPISLVCKEFGLKHWTTLELFEVLHRDGVLQLTQIDSVVQLWQYENDVPHPKWAKDFAKLFGKSPTMVPY